MDDNPIPSVQFTSPPPSILADALRIVDEGISQLEPGQNGAIVTIVTVDRDTGKIQANAAIVARVGEHMALHGWIGKTWGSEVVGGGAVKIRW